ncbi:MAG: hypothetical protein DI556_20715 [Rhodovulum sulfidophilum]|uniref:Uncharacterized protein n=1 Tax=Rhodovulum sulfidophilum TaxID=35806 RepID=A0A2W5Q4J4_RHOSU|nr:MAG: hypothetical protein DI556_20715 [Rhodovulum sulfidophilum]
MIRRDGPRAGIALAAERIVTRRGLATPLVIGPALYRRDELAWFTFRARSRDRCLRSIGSETPRALGAP